MKSRVLLDTGPMVAFLVKTDRYHAWAKHQLQKVTPPLLTCEAVLSEICFLLRHNAAGKKALFEQINRGLIEVPFRLEEESEAIKKLMDRYHRIPMSIADACLVRMNEQFDESVVFTIDNDFRIYRKHGRQAIATLMPE